MGSKVSQPHHKATYQDSVSGAAVEAYHIASSPILKLFSLLERVDSAKHS